MSSVRRVSFVFAAAAAAALAIAPPAAAGRTIRLKVPRFVVPPHTDREVCTFVRVPMKKALDLGGSVIVNVGGHGSFTTHHFLMWVYEGTDTSRFPPKGQLVDSKACLDFGPADTNRRNLIGGAQQPKLVTRLPKGLDRKSTRLNSSHLVISYAVFCLKKKKKESHNLNNRKKTSERKR